MKREDTREHFDLGQIGIFMKGPYPNCAGFRKTSLSKNSCDATSVVGTSDTAAYINIKVQGDSLMRTSLKKHEGANGRLKNNDFANGRLKDNDLQTSQRDVSVTRRATNRLRSSMTVGHLRLATTEALRFLTPEELLQDSWNAQSIEGLKD
jgi:hypothetical protein